MIRIPYSPAMAQPARTLFGRVQRFLLDLVFDTSAVERTISGAMAQRVLVASLRTGVLDEILQHPGSEADAVAGACGCDPHGVDILLRALAGVGLLRRHGRGWKVRAQFVALLERGGFLRSWLEYADSVIAPAMLHLEAGVREGRPAGLHALYGGECLDFYGAVAGDPTRGPVFADFMRAYSAINRERVAGHQVFARSSSVLDLGGGDGDLAEAIVNRHPGVHVTVADLPEVVARTGLRFADLGQNDRLHVHSLDLRHDPIPQGFDTIVCAHLLDILSPTEVAELLQRARGALPPDGRLVIFTPVTDHDGCGPLINSLMGIYFLVLACGRGRFYSVGELVHIARKAGFHRFTTTPLPCDEVVITAV